MQLMSVLRPPRSTAPPTHTAAIMPPTCDAEVEPGDALLQPGQHTALSEVPQQLPSSGHVVRTHASPKAAWRGLRPRHGLACRCSTAPTVASAQCTTLEHSKPSGKLVLPPAAAGSLMCTDKQHLQPHLHLPWPSRRDGRPGRQLAAARQQHQPRPPRCCRTASAVSSWRRHRSCSAWPSFAAPCTQVTQAAQLHGQIDRPAHVIASAAICCASITGVCTVHVTAHSAPGSSISAHTCRRPCMSRPAPAQSAWQ